MKAILLILWLGCSTLCAETLRLHFKPDDHVLGDVHPFIHQGECFPLKVRWSASDPNAHPIVMRTSLLQAPSKP